MPPACHGKTQVRSISAPALVAASSLTTCCMDSQAAAAGARKQKNVQPDLVKRNEKRTLVAQRLIEKYETNKLVAPMVLLDLATREDLSKRSWEGTLFLARKTLEKQLSGDLYI